VPDVVGLYGDVVRIAHDAPAFIAACEAALGASDEDRESLRQRSSATVARSSWDRAAQRVLELIDPVIRTAARAAD
jgi:hypothetical protein